MLGLSVLHLDGSWILLVTGPGIIEILTSGNPCDNSHSEGEEEKDGGYYL